MRCVPLPLVSITVAAGLLLSGCGLLPELTLPQGPLQQTGVPTTGASAGAPAGWDFLPHCDGAPEQPWVWIEGFPAEEFDSSGARVDCGDVWSQDDADTFVGIASFEISDAQLDAFGAALEESGYEKLWDDFEPGTPSGESYYGARDYYLDGVSGGNFTRLAIEIYPSHSDSARWAAYIDFLSPATRQLG